jgi:hypothetical protein
MGVMEKAVFQRHEATKERLPDRIANAPEVQLGLDLFWNGFANLTSCRGSAYNSEGPIPWVAMRDYCEDYDIRGEQRMDFYHLIAEMDKVFLDHKAKKIKQQVESSA